MADRLLFNDVELQRPSADGPYAVWFEFLEGGPSDAVPQVRGEDWVYPGKAGRTAGDREAESLQIVLVGWVAGDGTSHSAQREDYAALMAELLAVLDPTASPATLEVHAPVEGLSTGETATITARFLRYAAPPKEGEAFRRFTLYFEAIGDPPAWTITP